MSGYDFEELIKRAVKEKLEEAWQSGGAGRTALLEELGRKAAESKASIFNGYVIGGTDIFPSPLSPTYTPSIFRIYCCFNLEGVLTVRRMKDGVTVSEQLNAGGSLAANAAYIFDIIVDEGETINLRYSQTSICLKLSVIEIGGMV